MPVGLDGNPDPIRSAARDALLAEIVREILPLCPSDRICVGVDGAPGAGKSTFADEIARLVRAAGHPTIRSTTDSFHRPRAERYRRGKTSAEGYYRDSHNLDAIRSSLLLPFTRGEPVRVAAFDEPTDRPLTVAPEDPPPAAVLVFDGLFLHRPELRGSFQYSVFLVSPERRQRDIAAVRDRIESDCFEGFMKRYVGGWRLYREECRPESRATRVIDNDDFANPAFIEPHC